MLKGFLRALGALICISAGAAFAQVPDLSGISPTATGTLTPAGATGMSCSSSVTGYGAQDYKNCSGPGGWELRFPAKDLTTCQAVAASVTFQNMQEWFEKFVAEMHGVPSTARAFNLSCSDGWTP